MDNTVGIWNIATARMLHTLVGHKDSVTAIGVSKDGKWLVSASEDKTVKLWDIDTGKELATLSGHAAAVLAIAFSPDGTRVVSGSKGVLKIWAAD